MTSILFRVGARRLSADACEVAEVVRRPLLTRVPNAPAALAGLGAVRGRSTPVIELRRWLGQEQGVGDTMMILSGDAPAAIAVDAVEGLGVPESAEPFYLRAVVAQVIAQSARTAAAAPALSARPRPEKGEDARDLLAFMLGRQRFAFPIGQARAVLRAPRELDVAPDADPVVCGLAPYGEGVLPVVELAWLLGQTPSARSAETRLVVVEVGGAPIGLIVERVLGLMRVGASAVRAAPAILNRGAGEARVAAIALTPLGLTAVLAADRLFDEATTRRLGQRAPVASAVQPLRPDSAVETFLVFRLGAERYGLPIAATEGVARPPANRSPPPNAPPFLAGVMSRRGETVPLVDQRLRFGVAPPGEAEAVVFVGNGEIQAGLLVDAVERLASLPRDALPRSPAFAGDAGALFARVAIWEFDGQPLLIADPESLLGQARRDLGAWGRT